LLFPGLFHPPPDTRTRTRTDTDIAEKCIEQDKTRRKDKEIANDGLMGQMAKRKNGGRAKGKGK
jgi:hypothetical protein